MSIKCDWCGKDLGIKNLTPAPRAGGYLVICDGCFDQLCETTDKKLVNRYKQETMFGLKRTPIVKTPEEMKKLVDEKLDQAEVH